MSSLAQPHPATADRPAPGVITGAVFGVVVFIAAVAGYTNMRLEYPETFLLGTKLLDPVWGLLSAGVLILGSILFLVAGYLTSRGNTNTAAVLYALTLVLAIDHVGIRAIEWMQLGRDFEERRAAGLAELSPPPETPETETPALAADEPFAPGDPGTGASLYRASCASCHGPQGRGMAGLGTDLAAAPFVLERTDAELVEFLKQGRLPGDPNSILGMLMPARGGNPRLSDRDLAHIVAFVRTLETDEAADRPDAVDESTPPAGVDFEVAQSVVPTPEIGPQGAGEHVFAGTAPPGHQRIDPVAAGLARTPREEFRGFRMAFLFVAGFQVLFAVAVAGVTGLRLASSLFGFDGTVPRQMTPMAETLWHVTAAASVFVLPLCYFARWF